MIKLFTHVAVVISQQKVMSRDQKDLNQKGISFVTDLCRRECHPSFYSSDTPRASCRSHSCIQDMIGIRRILRLYSRCGIDKHLVVRTFHGRIPRNKSACRSSRRSIRAGKPFGLCYRRCSGRRNHHGAYKVRCRLNYSSAKQKKEEFEFKDSQRQGINLLHHISHEF